MDATKGLFDLDVFKESSEDDLTKASIGESGSGSEFQSNDPAINPTKDQPSAGADGKVSIPGGEKEAPTAKAVEGSNPSVPGGDGEKPSTKPDDGTNPSIPSKATLTTSEWNSMMSSLKNSFKEGVALMEMLENANIIDLTPEQAQKEFTENAIFEAMAEAYINGPYFEAVEREDKYDVQKITNSIRKEIVSKLKKESVKFYKPNLLLRAIAGTVTGVDLASAVQTVWQNRLWQIVGCIVVEEGNVKTVVDDLNDTFKKDLDEYKILDVAIIPSLLDVFRVKFNWKNSKGVRLLVIDKKLPSELKKIKAEDAAPKDDKGAKTEAAENNEPDDSKEKKDPPEKKEDDKDKE